MPLLQVVRQYVRVQPPPEEFTDPSENEYLLGFEANQIRTQPIKTYIRRLWLAFESGTGIRPKQYFDDQAERFSKEIAFWANIFAKDELALSAELEKGAGNGDTANHEFLSDVADTILIREHWGENLWGHKKDCRANLENGKPEAGDEGRPEWPRDANRITLAVRQWIAAELQVKIRKPRSQKEGHEKGPDDPDEERERLRAIYSEMKRQSSVDDPDMSDSVQVPSLDHGQAEQEHRRPARRLLLRETPGRTSARRIAEADSATVTSWSMTGDDSTVGSTSAATDVSGTIDSTPHPTGPSMKRKKTGMDVGGKRYKVTREQDPICAPEKREAKQRSGTHSSLAEHNRKSSRTRSSRSRKSSRQDEHEQIETTPTTVFPTPSSARNKVRRPQRQEYSQERTSCRKTRSALESPMVGQTDTGIEEITTSINEPSTSQTPVEADTVSICNDHISDVDDAQKANPGPSVSLTLLGTTRYKCLPPTAEIVIVSDDSDLESGMHRSQADEAASANLERVNSSTPPTSLSQEPNSSNQEHDTESTYEPEQLYGLEPEATDDRFELEIDKTQAILVGETAFKRSALRPVIRRKLPGVAHNLITLSEPQSTKDSGPAYATRRAAPNQTIAETEVSANTRWTAVPAPAIPTTWSGYHMTTGSNGPVLPTQNLEPPVEPLCFSPPVCATCPHSLQDRNIDRYRGTRQWRTTCKYCRNMADGPRPMPCACARCQSAPVGPLAPVEPASATSHAG